MNLENQPPSETTKSLTAEDLQRGCEEDETCHSALSCNEDACFVTESELTSSLPPIGSEGIG